jgi:hypothetical protein
MLLILILILSHFGKKPIYYFGDKQQNNQHNKVSGNDAEKASDPGYTGDVLIRNDHLQYKKDTIDDIDYTNSELCSSEMPFKEENLTNDAENYENDISYIGQGDRKNQIPQYEAKLDRRESIEESSKVTKPTATRDCGSVIESEVVPEYPSKLIMTDKDCGQIIVNVPVLLTQFEIEFATEAIITLDRPIQDIKRIKKNVLLGQCSLLPKANKLFLGGAIRQNIEYGTEDNIRHVTVEVPFKCTTEVQFFMQPIIKADCEMLEIETQMEDGRGMDLSEKTLINSENFNDRVYCKLLSDEVREVDILDENKGKDEKTDCEKLFETLSEKMVVKLYIELLQEQHIVINK